MIKIILKGLWSLPALALLLFLLMDNNREFQHAIQYLEHKAYDWTVSHLRRTTDGRIVIVAVDDNSLNHLGAWPWPSQRLVDLLNDLAQKNTKVIVNLLPWSEKGFRMEPEDDYQPLASAFRRAGNVVQGLEIRPSASHVSRSDHPVLSSYLGVDKGKTLLHLPLANHHPAPLAAIPPLTASLGLEAQSVGFFLDDEEEDGIARSSRLIMTYGEQPLPSLALAAVARSQNIPLAQITWSEETLHVGPLDLVVDHRFRTYHRLYQGTEGHPPLTILSVADVLNGSTDPILFQQKIVLIGTTAPSLHAPLTLSDGTQVAPVELLGYRLATLLNQDDFHQPPQWARYKMAMVAIIACFFLWIMPSVDRRTSLLLSLLLGSLMAWGYYVALSQQALWLPMAEPFLLLVIGSTLNLLHPPLFRTAKTYKAEVEEDLAKRMLGLALQGQGQFGQAFAHFKSCRTDPILREMLDNLATDCEKNRDHGQAIEVLNHMKSMTPDGQDLAERLEKNLWALTETRKNEGLSVSPAPLPLSIDHYYLDEPLARGTLGTVFRGRDARHNQRLAVKVIPMTEHFPPSLIDQVRQRFEEIFTLNKALHHPNILQVFQWGVSDGRLFMAMEYFPGRNLAYYARKHHLLPLPLVIQLVAKVAMALEFAREKGVVHGALKPSDVIFDPKNREIKVINFSLHDLIRLGRGSVPLIAPRSLDHPRPCYLAPECAAGTAPDFRSDIFALGVLFYQLLTGETPYTTEKKNTSDQNPVLDDALPIPLRSRNPELPECLEKIINQAIHPEPNERFQRGIQLARALVACVKSQLP